MSRLITASLIGAVDWFLKSPPSWKERAYKSLHDQLARVWGDMPTPVKKGIAFEKDVYNILEGKVDFKYEKASDEFKHFLNVCRGGKFQNKNKMFVDINNEEYCLYAKEDAFFPKSNKNPGHIIDIKTSAKWGGKSKYLNTWQHKLYCLIEEITTFDYEVAIWEDANDVNNRKIKEVHTVNYVVKDFAQLKKDVVQKVADTISVLQSDDELWNLYLTKFCLY